MPEKLAQTPSLISTGYHLLSSIVTSEKFIASFFGLTGGLTTIFFTPFTKWHFRKKELIREDRKKKIITWRRALSEFDKISNFHNNPSYLELIAHMPNKEKNEIFSDNSICVEMFSDSTNVTEVSDRIITRLYKVISDLEKKWGLL